MRFLVLDDGDHDTAYIFENGDQLYFDEVLQIFAPAHTQEYIYKSAQIDEIKEIVGKIVRLDPESIDIYVENLFSNLNNHYSTVDKTIFSASFEMLWAICPN